MNSLHLLSLDGPKKTAVTLGESAEPDSTMSMEHPGKSSTRDGLRLNTALSLRAASSPRESFLHTGIGGRTVRPDRSPTLVCWDPSIRQYSRWVRRPWLVSLKWYWHDPGLERRGRSENKANSHHWCFSTGGSGSCSDWVHPFLALHSIQYLVRVSVRAEWSLCVYLKCVPRSRLGAKGRSVVIVVPVPVAERWTVCVLLSRMDTSSLSSKRRVSFRLATTLRSNWPPGETSPSLGSTRQKDFLPVWGNTVQSQFSHLGKEFATSRSYCVVYPYEGSILNIPLYFIFPHLCLYHASSEESRNGWLVQQLQHFSAVCQNPDFTKVQLWTLNMDCGALANTWQDHLLEKIRALVWRKTTEKQSVACNNRNLLGIFCEFAAVCRALEHVGWGDRRC